MVQSVSDRGASSMVALTRRELCIHCQNGWASKIGCNRLTGWNSDPGWSGKRLSLNRILSRSKLLTLSSAKFLLAASVDMQKLKTGQAQLSGHHWRVFQIESIKVLSSGGQCLWCPRVCCCVCRNGMALRFLGNDWTEHCDCVDKSELSSESDA